jgi:hypothetical protein
MTAAQAFMRFLACPSTEIDGVRRALFAGVWAIFENGCRSACHRDPTSASKNGVTKSGISFISSMRCGLL